MKNTHILVKFIYLFLIGAVFSFLLLFVLFLTNNITLFSRLIRYTLLAYFAVICGLVLSGYFKRHSSIFLYICSCIRGILAIIVFVAVIIGGINLSSLCSDNNPQFSLTSPFFSNKNVLIFVPHQDDDINLIGGILEQYIQGNSQVSVVFATNGDLGVPAERRYKEAILALGELGVSEADIYFLGFGDQWQAQTLDSVSATHIYNSPSGSAIWTSQSGASHTYGTSYHPCYLNLPYTRDNYVTSIKSILIDISPDVIYCTDYDSHQDHRALDLFFDEAMGALLRDNPDYHPTIYKGFCYETAWNAKPDYFSSINLKSTKLPDSTGWNPFLSYADWNSRVRIPLGEDNLNRFLSQNTIYRALRHYSSQYAYPHSECVLNGDKVFWERRTGSLLYHAAFYVDELQTGRLNDFKLKDSFDLGTDIPSDGYISGNQINVHLDQATLMDELIIYGNSDLLSSIRDGILILSDGSTITLNPISLDNTSVSIQFPRKLVDSFCLSFNSTYTSLPQISEIEAYLGRIDSQQNPMFVMALDENDNFVYDYWIEDGNSVTLNTYAYPYAIPLDDLDIQLSGSADCSYSTNKNTLTIVCPEGSEATIRLIYSDAVQTEFHISNPPRVSRNWTHLQRYVDHHTAYFVDSLRSFIYEILWYHFGISY